MKPWTQASRSAPLNPKPRASTLSCVATLLAFIGFCSSLLGQGQPTTAVRHDRLDVIFSRSLLPTSNRNDALALIRVWTETLGRQPGVVVDLNASVADDVAEIEKRARQGPIGWVLLDPVEYFQLERLGLLEPAFMGSFGKNDEPEQFLLVTNQGSGVVGVDGLRGKSLAIQSEYRANLGRIWVEVLLQERGLGPLDRFFDSVNAVPTPSAATLPVFFGKVGAGVVERNCFEVMKEMNPQIGVKLRVLAESPPLIRGFLCLDRRPAVYHANLVRELRDLDQNPAGKQILTLFRVNRLKPMSRDDLEPTRELYTKYQLIAGKAVASRTASWAAKPVEDPVAGRPEVKP